MADFSKRNALGRVLTGIIVLAIIGAVVALGFTVANPREESFTEFYLLGLDGKADNYPGQLKIGEAGKVIVGIINRENQASTYRLQVTINGKADKEIGPLTLKQKEKWEQEVSFLPSQAGDKQKVEFLLLREGQTGVYRTLRLWVDVR